MKIKSLHLTTALMSLGHKGRFDCPEHTVEFDEITGMFKIDSYTLVPMHAVKEVILEREEVMFESTEVAKKTLSRKRKACA